jgi:hypothetical protein
MRTKLIVIATALVALAVGVTSSNAALQNAIQVKMNFKKAGGPGSLSVQLINMDDAPLPDGVPLSATQLQAALNDGGLVPQRIAKLVVQSTSAKFNSKALPYCRLGKVVLDPVTNAKTGFEIVNTIPTRATGMTGAEQYTYVPGKQNDKDVVKACPAKSLIGKGDFTAVIGTPGQPYNPSQAGAISGKVYLYNYKPQGSDQFGTLAMLSVQNPVPANQYLYNGVDRKNVLRAVVPSRAEIPTNLDASLPAGEVAMTSLSLKMTAPKPAKGKKPIFTVKSFSNLNVYGQLVRD